MQEWVKKFEEMMTMNNFFFSCHLKDLNYCKGWLTFETCYSQVDSLTIKNKCHIVFTSSNISLLSLRAYNDYFNFYKTSYVSENLGNILGSFSSSTC